MPWIQRHPLLLLDRVGTVRDVLQQRLADYWSKETVGSLNS
jgi:hypothetical protein